MSAPMQTCVARIRGVDYPVIAASYADSIDRSRDAYFTDPLILVCSAETVAVMRRQFSDDAPRGEDIEMVWTAADRIDSDLLEVCDCLNWDERGFDGQGAHILRFSVRVISRGRERRRIATFAQIARGAL